MKELTVEIVDDKSSNLADNLGITEERQEFLRKKIQKAIMIYDKIHEIANEVSNHCIHANELWWCGMQMGSWYQKQKQPDLLSLFKNLGKGEED